MAPPDSSTGDQLATCVWVEPEIGLQHSLRVEVDASADLGRVRAEDPDARPITLPGADPAVVEVSTEFKEVAIWAIKGERAPTRRCSSGLSGRRPSGPFVGLTAEAPAGVAETLREATLQSWHGIVQLALGERVDFVVVAGDVFEHANRTLRGQIRFRDGLADLARARIPSFVVTGNHDPLSGWEPSVVCCLRVGLLKTITSALGLRSSSLPSSALARAHSRSLADYPRSPRFRRTAAATRRRRGPDRTDDRA